ncbi:cytochrome P450 [Trametes elegans]|nr:cytochrome P450 [Trametes elegans]
MSTAQWTRVPPSLSEVESTAAATRTGTLFLALLPCTLLLIAFGKLCRRPRGSHNFPPGPPAKAILGNIFNVSPQGGWYKFTEYQRTYGDLVFFHGLGNHVLVLNSLKTINDLLDKRGNIYSDRPRFTVVGDLMGLGQSMPLLPYGNEWKVQRKLAHTALSPSAVKQYYSVQERIATMLCRDILNQPRGFFDHVRLAAARLILTVTYGLEVASADDEYVSHAEETMRMISQATVPGAFLCDLIPWIRYLPSWIPFQREAAKGRSMIERLVARPFDYVKTEMHTSSPSLTRELLSLEENNTPEMYHHIKWSSGSLYGAGGETTYATVLTCIMAMALHRDKLRKVHAELDRVLGDRLPTVGDRASLPYLNAVIKETMRWHPVLPLSIARCTSQDDVYQGYTIPKGTIVMPNVWAVAFLDQGPHDATAFVPERFLGEDDTAQATDPAAWAFGFGRRVCPGRHLAENSLFIFIATMLATFDIEPPVDGALSPQFTQGLVSYPLPFDCKISPRSPMKIARIRHEAT